MNEREGGRKSWADVHPDFDGHLEKPLSEMTPKERLEWAWQGVLLLDMARRAQRIEREDSTCEADEA